VIDYGAILEEIRLEVEPLLGRGRVADYIEPLARVPLEKFGCALITVDGETFTTGDANERFSIQSIMKVFLLHLAMQYEGDGIWKRVGREPSGSAFNSLVQLEYEEGIPRNPFINAGAMVLTDIVLSRADQSADPLLELVRRLCVSDTVDFDPEVAASESSTGHRNRALAHFLKAYGNLHGDVDEILEKYFRYCSLSMSCVDLARAFGFLANGGRLLAGGVEVATPRQVKRINSVMLTCGVYDEAGDFAYRVGLPGKSGVGGGIAAVLPGRFSVAVWSPGLDQSGSSLAGTKALELLTTKTALSIF
jgi:glutaminase